jgi:hypothetical protein
MDCGKERQRLTGTMLSATTFEPVTIKDASRIWAELHDLCHACVPADLVHGFPALFANL